MNWDAWLPLLVIASSLLPGLIIFGLAEYRSPPAHRLQPAWDLGESHLDRLDAVGCLPWTSL